MKTKNENKIIINQWAQVFMIIIILIAMVFGIWAIIKSISHEEALKKELYNYNYNSNISYKVYLKRNDFYTAPYMGMNKQYIASLIDHIDVDTKYSFQSSKDLDYTYNYSLVATAKGVYSEAEGKSNEIWSKNYMLVPNETKMGTGQRIDVNKTVSIDYNKYNAIMNDFRTKFNLSVDARVDVTFKITITGNLKGDSKKTLDETSTMALQIPLLTPTIQIKPDYVNNGSKVIYDEPEEDNGINIPLLLFGIITILATLYLFKIYVGKLLQATKKSEYIIRLNKILKEYGDIIAETENLPDLSQYDVVSIKHFNDLVDIEEELHSPIICNEIREDLESWFLIFYDKTAYRFILKYEDFGKIINQKR